jgi:DNA-binding PadR family transcriptional regulator
MLMKLGTGTLYTALAGLVDDELVADAKRRLTASDDSRRRYYTLTPLGRRVLEAETSRLDALVRQARRQGIQPTGRPAWSRTK